MHFRAQGSDVFKNYLSINSSFSIINHFARIYCQLGMFERGKGQIRKKKARGMFSQFDVKIRDF